MSGIRQAFRRLANAPAFSLTVIGLLAIGLGANLTMFSGINSGMFKRQAGVADPDNLYEIGLDLQLNPVSLPEFRAIRQLDEVSGAAAIHTQEFGVALGEVSRLFGGAFVTANYLDLLGVRPFAGRFFREEEDVLGRCEVAVVSHALWSRFLNSDSRLIGGEIRVNGRKFQLIGVAPPEFTGTRRMDPDWIWMPLHARATFLGIPRLPDHPRTNWLSVLARPTPDGKAKLGFAIDGLRAEFQKYGGRAGQFRTLPYHPIGAAAAAAEAGGMAAMLLFGAWMVLAVVWANVANLFLARSLGRNRENAVRLALGASRGTLIRESFTEGLLLAGAGTAIAFLIATWLREGFLNLLPHSPDGDPVPLDFSTDWRVIAIAIAAALLSALFFAVLPTIRASRVDLNTALKAGDRGNVSHSSRLARALVVVQVALAVLMLVAGGVFIAASRQLRAADLGIDPEGMLLAQVSPQLNAYDRGREARFYEAIVDRARALPGVKSATAARFVPVDGSISSIGKAFGGNLSTEGENATANVAGDGYFSAIGLTLVEGRDFEKTDRAGHPNVAVINQTLAARAWPGESAVGKVIRTGPVKLQTEWRVIGVARDSAIAWLGSTRKHPHIYVPLQQLPAGRASLHIRAAGDPVSLAPAVRAIVAELDPYMPVTRVRTLREQADTTIWSSLVLSTMASWFAGLTLLLSAAGLYATLAHQVTARTREIGVRIALGAPLSRIVAATVRGGLTLAALGFALGAPLAWVATLKAPGPGTGPASPAMYLIAAAIIAATAIAASYFPARRAASVDPLAALRQE